MYTLINRQRDEERERERDTHKTVYLREKLVKTYF